MKAKLPLESFDFYVAIGPTRSYEKVAEHYQATKRTVTRHAKKERWAERLAEVERKAREESDKTAVAVLQEMQERHLKIAKALQGKALEALRSMQLDRGADVIRALEVGVKQERLIHGEPGERSAVSLEETTKREMERWLTLGLDQADQPEDEDADLDAE
jgi:hypothetical protein